MPSQQISLELLVSRIRALDEETLAEVSDFVDFLCQKKAKHGQILLDQLRERALPSVTLEQVRADLATLKGSLSEAVTELRQER